MKNKYIFQKFMMRICFLKCLNLDQNMWMILFYVVNKILKQLKLFCLFVVDFILEISYIESFIDFFIMIKIV